MMTDHKDTAEFLVHTLSAWFDVYGRDLPWRHSPTAYQVWISEIMLQQTQVVSVIPYYERWMARFPDVSSLASADISEVMVYWAGLGYYRRAQNLHACAQAVCAKYGGAFPQDVKTLKSLPGIGAYTAGAIASFAFGADVPAIDGNISRVLSRVWGISTDIERGEGLSQVRAAAEAVANHGNARIVSQAMMDLASSICGRTASCARCPLSLRCAAYAHGLTQSIPYKKPRSAKRVDLRTALLLRLPLHQYLIARRRPDVLMGNLWEFPMMTVASGDKPYAEAELSRYSQAMRLEQWRVWLAAHGCREILSSCEACGVLLKHELTHIRMHICADAAEMQSPFAPTAASNDEYDAFAWVHPDAFAQYAMSSMMKKIAASVPLVK